MSKNVVAIDLGSVGKWTGKITPKVVREIESRMGGTGGLARRLLSEQGLTEIASVMDCLIQGSSPETTPTIDQICEGVLEIGTTAALEMIGPFFKRVLDGAEDK